MLTEIRNMGSALILKIFLGLFLAPRSRFYLYKNKYWFLLKDDHGSH